MVLDSTLLSTQYYNVKIEGKAEQSRELKNALSLHLGVVTIEKGAFESPSTKVANFTFLLVHSSNLDICTSIVKVQM